MYFDNSHDIFIDYCNRNHIGNAHLELKNGLSITTENGTRYFNSKEELQKELMK